MARTIRKRKARITRVPVSMKARSEVEAEKPPVMTKLRALKDKDGNTVIVPIR